MGSTSSIGWAAQSWRPTGSASPRTEEKPRREGVTDKGEANAAHQRMGAAVRQFIAEQGGTMPEELPPPCESIQQARRRERKLLEASAAQPALFAEDDATGEEE